MSHDNAYIAAQEIEIREAEKAIKVARENSVPFFHFPHELEQEFRVYRHKRLLNRVPFIGYSGIFIFTIFAVLDVFILPEPAYILTTCIRILLICPLIAFAILASKMEWSIRAFSSYYLSAYVLAGLGIICIIYIARLNDFMLPYDGVLLHLVFGYFIMGMPFTLATAGGLCVTLGYVMIELHLNTPRDQLASNSLFIFTLNFMGFIGSYMQERSRRHLFLNKKQIELALAKDELEIESKTKLLATASHDLRQPIHAMNILVEALQNEQSTEAGSKFTLKLKESLRQLGQLLTSLLDISRFNAKIVDYHPQNIELSNLIKTLLHNQKIRSTELGIIIQENGPTPCMVNTDPVLLERVVRNLFENVYDHANASIITVSWSLQNEKIKLSIKDNGQGISEEDQDRIFEEFHQTKKGNVNGMGLGLTIVKQSCDIMQSRFGVKSSEGQGAEFWVELIASHHLDEVSKANVSSEPSNTNGIILIVEDDQTVLDSYCHLLTTWGYQIETYTQPETALAYIESIKADDPKQEVNLLLSDFNFPNSPLNGLDLIQSARDNYRNNLPAILITGSDEATLNQAGAETLLEHSDITEITFKPLAPPKLRLMLKHFLRDRK